MFSIRSIAYAALILFAASISVAGTPTARRAAEPTARSIDECKLDGDVHYTNVSGWESSVTDEISFPARDQYAIRTIKNLEYRDQPCKTVVHFGRFPYATDLVEEIGATASTCSGSVGDEIEVGANQFTPEGVFVGSIQAWTSWPATGGVPLHEIVTGSPSARLKGLAVNPRVITDDYCEVVPETFEDWEPDPEDIESGGFGGLTGYNPPPWEYKDTRVHDDMEHDMRFCLAGQVATGLILHYDSEDIVVGVQLMCRDVVHDD